MQNLTNKTIAIMISLFMIISIGAAITQTPSTAHGAINFPTEEYINVAPDPTGVGQSVTVDFWLAVPLQDAEAGGTPDTPVNMTVLVTLPDGTTTTLGPFVGDITGGTNTQYVPTQTGTYSFEMFYGGQTLRLGAFVGDYEEPGHSATVTLTVQATPVSSYPFTPLPTQYWQTPVNANNVQNWAAITGPWLGLLAEFFASTGLYNDSGAYNPYTTAPTTAHILWTKPWAVGGVAGGDSGNTETSDFWTTSQYEPKWAPVVMDGMEYSTWYTTTTGYSNGIVAYNLYNGQTEWIINTTNSLLMGMQVAYETPNMYGVVGPYLVTTGTLPPSDTGGAAYPESGTEFNLYDALSGRYVCSIVNGTNSGFMTVDSNGDPIMYYINNTSGTEIVTPNNGGAFGVWAGNPNPPHIQTNTGPTINAWNMTQALGQGDLDSSTGAISDWSLSYNHQYLWRNGLMWSAQTIPTTINGNLIGTNTTFNGVTYSYSGLGFGGLTLSEIGSNVVVASFGAGTQTAPSVGETPGWIVEAGFSLTNGAFLWINNYTETPYTRLAQNGQYFGGDGVFIDLNEATFVMNGYSLNTGDLLWTNTLTGANGANPDAYDEYGIQDIVDCNSGQILLNALGGDIWCVNMLTGTVQWYANTTALQGSSGTETPYGIWPTWVQDDGCIGGEGPSTIAYISEGHQYSPPLFHGAQVLALNMTNGALIWKNLAFDCTGEAVAYGIMTTYNAYDGQIYAYGQGPSATTVTAPSIGVTTATPIVISGTVMDKSAGATQEAVAANFPNGLPCVSDASQEQWMDYVYEQQPEPTNLAGVPVTLTDVDPNGNVETIGTTTSNAASGYYSITWTPPLAGNYTITATFAGSGAYYGSYAQTSIYSGNPPPTSAPTSTPVSQATTQSYVLGLGIAAIIVIIIIGAILAMLMLRKKP